MNSVSRLSILEEVPFPIRIFISEKLFVSENLRLGVSEWFR